jgi:hypothetical protein
MTILDMVNKPPHYRTGNWEVIDILKDQLSQEEYQGYLRGNVLKYLFRYKNKGGHEDLQKAQWYLDKLATSVKHEQSKGLMDHDRIEF